MKGVLDSLESLVNDGIFGDVEFVKATIKGTNDIGAQFASNLVFADLTVKCKSEEKLLPLVIKIECDITGNNVQFLNELIMYQEAIPALGFNQQFYPKLYYGRVGENDKEENMLIFEDLRLKNFVNSKQPIFLDFEHISIAIKKIAMLHSLSFIMKHREPDRFHELTTRFKVFFEDKVDNDMRMVHIVGLERGVRAFQERNGFDQVFDDLLKVTKNTFEVWKGFLWPEKPFDVIGHGDFCNNNIMYRYNENDVPVDCALIDFQRAGHISIGSELAFYLYMHTTAEMREKHWDEFLLIYWETLKQNVPDEIETFSFEDFMLHFSCRAVYGFFITSFFIPIMMARDEFKMELELDEKMEQARTLGGEEADEKLADVVSHLYHKKYIHQFLEFTKNQYKTNK